MPNPTSPSKLTPAQLRVLKKYKSGQNSVKSGLCIGTHLDGSSCDEPQAVKWVPYCKKCMKDGDPSMRVENHPKFGKCLVAARDLPKDYYSALFGQRQFRHEMPEADTEWGFETSVGDYVNPRTNLGSQIQFCQCPGPNERVTISFASDCINMEQLKKGKPKTDKYGSFTFVTSMPVPKNHQLMMMYAENEKQTEEFFEERGITRCDIGYKARPAVLKKRASLATKQPKK